MAIAVTLEHEDRPPQPTVLECDCWIENVDGAYVCAHPGNCRGKPIAPVMDSIDKARTHNLAFRRIMVTLILPVAIVFSVISRLGREMMDAVHLARLDAQGDIETAKQIWRR